MEKWPAAGTNPELWGGIECTINRIQDTYYDQLDRNGHASCIDDLNLFAQLGIRALRYPILWERFAPTRDMSSINWQWADDRMQRLQKLGVRPIIGLLHHGSGPRYTSLIETDFSDSLAQYAGEAACRFPWVEDWTPVNEPLTTARFSGMYGHWYPHGTSEEVFARAVVNQCRAVSLSMQAIRRTNPAARLIQTEDLGYTHSSHKLQYQAEFENERRWLTWDLLCGKVDRHHRMWGHLLWAGIDEAELHWFLDNPCPPDTIGINHYLTSERFLDEGWERYPPNSSAGNGKDRYADVEAVRVLSCNIHGPQKIMEEAWNRYKRPIALTEVHLGCTREEQMRWLLEVWNAACTLRNKGTDIQAVTVWALLGSYDWDSMLTRSNGHYESGVFDVRGGVRRPTALADMMQTLAKGQQPNHPVLDAAGWWQRPIKRSIYGLEAAPRIYAAPAAHKKSNSPLLICGASEILGKAFARLCDHRNIAFEALSRQQIDITDPASVQDTISFYKPWAVINTMEYIPLSDSLEEEERCLRENTAGPSLLAAICARENIRFTSFSSDQVFNGCKSQPYVESDRCTPANLYGRSKAKSEASILQILPSALVVRVGVCFGPWDDSNFVTRALRCISEHRNFSASDQMLISATYVPDLVHACLDLLIDGASGIWHLANEGAVSWKRLAELAAAYAGFSSERVLAEPIEISIQRKSKAFSRVLGTERGQLLQPLESALECYMLDCDIKWTELKRAG